ncbi:MAG: class I SAM-dependent methyltransferase [Bacteroidetes bacterium]|nr:class I SAM-dependent methyltransferase [Bacteroidota bacterium]
MGSLKDEQGHNQGFRPGTSTDIRTRRRAQFMMEQMSLKEGIRVLEIGCGTGEIAGILAKEMKSAGITGMDISQQFIDQAIASFPLPNLTFFKGNFLDEGATFHGSFDYIVGNGILHHLYPDLDHAFPRIKALLKKNGKIIFLEPNLYNPYCFLIFNTTPFFRRWAKLEPDEKAFTGGFMEKKLKKAGFSEIKIEYRDFLLPGIPPIFIKPSILLGNHLEKIPLLNRLSQSIFLTALTTDH